jgi:hypothetical protein
LTVRNAKRHIAAAPISREAGEAGGASSGGEAMAACDAPTAPRGWEEIDVLVKPYPSELAAPINPDRGVEGHRNLFCSYYDGCLDEAVKKGWNSWSCTRCELFAVQPNVEEGLETYATQRRLA